MRSGDRDQRRRRHGPSEGRRAPAVAGTGLAAPAGGVGAVPLVLPGRVLARRGVADHHPDRVSTRAAVHRFVPVPGELPRPRPDDERADGLQRDHPPAAAVGGEPDHGGGRAAPPRAGDGRRDLRGPAPPPGSSLARRAGDRAADAGRLPAPDRAQRAVGDAVRGADPRRGRRVALGPAAADVGAGRRRVPARRVGQRALGRAGGHRPRGAVRGLGERGRLAAAGPGRGRRAGVRAAGPRLRRLLLGGGRHGRARERRRDPPLRAGGDDRGLSPRLAALVRAGAVPASAARPPARGRRLRAQLAARQARARAAREDEGPGAARLRAAGVQAAAGGSPPRGVRRRREELRPVPHHLAQRRVGRPVAVPGALPDVPE